MVTRAVSGHATEEMHRHYSTVQTDEIRSGIAKVIELAGFREALATVSTKESSGMHGPSNDEGRSAASGESA